eukprot:TRINITY_DN0_c496_g1_i2.p1 TRINITY_DN0_c496_g1~~TRINITY_DN0_c496_g1_i2.p1  ORF type:complete len:126 (-),score=50.61 TRINITY_DN0_c496_g1_i2:63-440(-)
METVSLNEVTNTEHVVVQTEDLKASAGKSASKIDRENVSPFKQEVKPTEEKTEAKPVEVQEVAAPVETAPVETEKAPSEETKDVAAPTEEVPKASEEAPTLETGEVRERPEEPCDGVEAEKKLDA